MSRKNSVFSALPIVAAHYGEKFGVKVVIGGSGAGTDGNTILVPNVPESYPNKDVIWGYLTHEAAHVRHTDFGVWNSVAEKGAGALRTALLNVLEDARIEHAIMQQFPGVRSDLDATVTYLKESGLFQSVSGQDDPGKVLQAKLLYWLRANMLQQPIADLAETADQAMQEVFPEGVNTRLAVLLRKAVKTEGTADCLELVDKILSMLEEEAEKEEEKSQGDDSSPDDEASSDDPSDQDSDANSGSKGGDDQDQSSDGDDGDQYPQPNTGSSNGDDASHGDCDLSQEVADAANQAASQIRKALQSSADDLSQDAFEALKAELCQEADLNGDDTYCTVPTAPPTGGDELAGRQLLDQVQNTTSKLRSQLMGLVQAARRNRDFARRHGRKLDGKRVTRILSGDTRIFKKREDRPQANTAVHVLTDLSSSMNGHSEQVAREASLAISLALEAIPGVSPAVTYFRGYSDDPVRSAVRHGQSVRRQAHRFIEPSQGCTPMAEGLWYAAYELSKMGEDRKLMVVITDGEPDNAKACHTVLDLCRNAGIETVGIGICHQKVEEFFDRSIVINSVDELRNTLFQLMRDKLTVEAA
ncbi:MAG: VWA domain-containing protein [gamma proteobacterium symbiont of Clathrolucina costata]